MTEIDLGAEVREIVRRLAAVDLTDGRLDRDGAESALHEFLKRLGLAPKAVRWAEGPREAEALMLGREGESAAGEISAGLSKLAQRRVRHATHSPELGVAQDEATRAYNATAWLALNRVFSSYLPGADWSADDYLQNNKRRRVWEWARGAAFDASVAAGELARLHEAGDDTEESRAFATVKLPLLDAYAAGVHLYWVTTKEVVVLRRPELYVNESGRPHADGRAAALWPGGESFYFLNGVNVPAEVALTPASELDPQLVVRERNAEVRREIVRKIGIERVLAGLGAKCVDRRGDYELLMLDLGDRRARPFLKMKNPSVPGVYHVEGVHPRCRTVAQALAWRNGTDVPPSVLT